MSETPNTKSADIAGEINAALASFGARRVPESGEGIESIVNLARAANGVEVDWLPTEGLGEGLPEAVPLLIDRRQGGKVVTLREEIERYRTNPDRRRGTARVTTLRAFVDLVNRHKDDGSVIFARTEWPEPGLTAVIDYHTRDNHPRHGEHRVQYPYPVTQEFKAWIGNNGKQLSQADFAEFLEERAPDLAEPTDIEIDRYTKLFKTRVASPNEVFDLARGLSVSVDMKVANHVKIQSGESAIVFSEQHTNDKGEPIVVPGLFILQVPAFIDGEAVRIPVRLRYRVKGGDIVWAYALYQWEQVLRDRVKLDLEQVEFDTKLPVFEGTPEGRA
ncbi:DUF2303 family protein [Chelatococcus asaccharovorans]|uniref:DUF2303 family protein n=1 Tax=Chelatococcus asaccharovorans TaxID=28210 RepID=UPI00224C6387|nr:DUF2303 family protein [Chelatococcus asaccharovorans]CAH1671841.1 conserved hypothetical protein [Chelatococcus asaccharovorans]CAH1676746.1 conserved hypothetical protein [Chelatococcus asaccharovorans]